MNQMILFQNRNKLRRGEEAVMGIRPAHQGLETADFLGQSPYQRLVIDLDIALCHSLLNMIHNISLFGQKLSQLLIIIARKNFPFFFYTVTGDFCLITKRTDALLFPNKADSGFKIQSHGKIQLLYSGSHLGYRLIMPGTWG